MARRIFKMKLAQEKETIIEQEQENDENQRVPLGKLTKKAATTSIRTASSSQSGLRMYFFI